MLMYSSPFCYVTFRYTALGTIVIFVCSSLSYHIQPLIPSLFHTQVLHRTQSCYIRTGHRIPARNHIPPRHRISLIHDDYRIALDTALHCVTQGHVTLVPTPPAATEFLTLSAASQRIHHKGTVCLWPQGFSDSALM